MAFQFSRLHTRQHRPELTRYKLPLHWLPAYTVYMATWHTLPGILSADNVPVLALVPGMCGLDRAVAP